MENITAPTNLPCLPEREAIRAYPKENWLIIGHLTHANQTSATTQLQHFREMIHALGYPNRVFARRLHWLVRVGGHRGHIHLHFLLGRHQLLDGHRHRYTAAEVLNFLQGAWKPHGMARIELFDSSRPGIEYVLRREPDGHGNEVEMSEGLISQIKKIKNGTDRDPLVADLVASLRAAGVRAGFGDEIEKIRGGAA